MSIRLVALAVIGLCLVPNYGHTQAVRARPYDAQLRTDPAVGNIQGIQRYGRPLKTDPDQGEGYSYHVYPVGFDPARGWGPEVLAQFLAFTSQQQDAGQKKADAPAKEAEPRVSQQQTMQQFNLSSFVPPPPTLYPLPLYAPPFDATAGLRNPYPGQAPPPFAVPATLIYGGRVELEAVEPLIQVKVRVVEVARGHQLLTSSVLDYISHVGEASLITANNVNNNRQRTTGATRFPVGQAGGLIDFTAASGMMGTGLAGIDKGAGLLVNLTSEHLNYIARLLATEFNGDIVTAPEVVTLNGQNVEFVAGSKLPFALGQNVIQGNAANIQQFFYKHVGTFISVTPRIVNWGLHAEGEGSAVVTAGEIADWNAVVAWMLCSKLVTDKQLREELQIHKNSGKPVVPIDLRGRMLQQLKLYPKEELKQALLPLKCSGDCPCKWNPQDCTIDMEIVVRLSDTGMFKIEQTADGKTVTTVDMPTESDIRAIANVIQVKSGHGVVMAGLIGEREVEEISKVPVLGDVPVLGFLFRSQGKNRQKTEVLIFVEAQVLDTRPECARAQSANDFTLGQPFVAGEFLDNPLEYGMYRAGFGTYLPPHSKSERVYWERLGRKVRKVCTTVDDALK